MTTFKYRGLSTDGQKISGVVKAYNEYEAVTQLRETCAVITHIQEVKEKTGLNRNLSGTRIKEKDLSIMCSQFSIILTSGLSIMRCVEMVAEQARTPELRASLLKVAEDVSGGYHREHKSVDELLLPDDHLRDLVLDPRHELLLRGDPVRCFL